ncbi:hypothetical protein J1C56_28875 [Aminobacter anthyllidis]|uniref:Uncharacterized protein n=1 Tax=Aminobacter anthyllidis TaxID=1035067 RepID=A0A9X1D919_9HYPH|nr:hypothetical protein [Aminobacter anthyllidis]MBT1159573.1 hypothetical protein [Aminobacter anthyllidis]
MSLSPEILVGYLRKEYKSAASHRVFLFWLQLLVALPGAISVITIDETLTYFLTIGAVVLLVIWWLAYSRYQRTRDAAETARRTALLVGGLGYKMSADETLAFRAKMTISEEEAEASIKADYYNTRIPAGPARLAEMLHESAFYTAALQKISAFAMMALFVVLVVAFAAVAFAALPYVEHATALIIMRIFLALMVFWMSTDVLGACLAHRSAAAEIERVKTRLQIARKDNYPLHDVMMIMGDYNAAVGSAPEVVPWAYDLSAPKLNRMWDEYIANVHQVVVHA